MLNGEAQHDTLHLSDWPLTADSFFAVTRLPLCRGNRVQAKAHAFALQLHEYFAGIRTIYLRGSAIESKRSELVKDVDFLAVMDHATPERRSQIREYVTSAWTVEEAYPRCDFSFIDLARVIQEPFSAANQLIIAFRACLLAGDPVWTTPPRVRPDVGLALRCKEAHCRHVNLFLEKDLTSPQKYEAGHLIPWMQKKALRLGGILAMGASARFSRHPLRCATLVAETYPDMESLASKVAHDYVSARYDDHAWRQARFLFNSLAEINPSGGIPERRQDFS